MDFLFHLFNHNAIGKRSLEDVIGIIGHQLRALGHDAVWDPKNDILWKDGVAPETDITYWAADKGYNVVVEGFTDWSVEVLRRAHERGARFICLATEEPTQAGFNHGLDPEMVRRQEKFCEVAPYLDAIWHLVPGQRVSDWYSQYAPTAYLELGYAPSLYRPDPRVVPDFEFGFYGSMSPRREALLRKLAKATGTRNAVKVVMDFKSQIDRDIQMRRAKVILQVRKFDEMGLVSSSRCNTALCLGRPVVAEPHDLSQGWEDVVKFTSSESDFIGVALLTRARWREAWERQFAAFRKKFSPEACLGTVLDATVGRVAPALRRAA